MYPGSRSTPHSAASHRCGLNLLAPLAAALLLAGCSTFEREWRSAAQMPRLEDDLAGRWEGTWRSEVTGHNDQLRAVIAAGSNGVYLTHFHARYRKGIFRFAFGYSVPLQARQTNGTHQFLGEADLGWLAGGLYRYEGSATATRFFSTYHCKRDHGAFELKRPGQSYRP